jgi:hypothetical protein
MALTSVVSVRFFRAAKPHSMRISRMTQSVMDCVTTRSVGTISLLAMGLSQFH